MIIRHHCPIQSQSLKNIVWKDKGAPPSWQSSSLACMYACKLYYVMVHVTEGHHSVADPGGVQGVRLNPLPVTRF